MQVHFAAGPLMVKHRPLGNRQNCVSDRAAPRMNGVVCRYDTFEVSNMISKRDVLPLPLHFK